MADQPTFQIPKEIIQPIIQAQVNEAVLRALDGPGNIVTQAVLSVLNTRVDSEGKPNHYNGSAPWIDWVIGDCIRKAARAAIEEQLTKHGDALKASLVQQMQQKNSPLVKQLVAGMVGAMTHPDVMRWRINVAFDPK